MATKTLSVLLASIAVTGAALAQAAPSAGMQRPATAQTPAAGMQRPATAPTPAAGMQRPATAQTPAAGMQRPAGKGGRP